MPEPLWAAAVALAEWEGVYHTARVLALNYRSLQTRVAGAGRAARRAPDEPRGFVELAPPFAPAAPAPSGPVLELVDRRGTRLTLRLRPTPSVDLERLATHLLEAVRLASSPEQAEVIDDSKPVAAAAGAQMLEGGTPLRALRPCPPPAPDPRPRLPQPPRHRPSPASHALSLLEMAQRYFSPLRASCTLAGRTR